MVIFEEPISQAQGVTCFKTNEAKEAWKNTHRHGEVEDQFIKPALFSRLLLPFGNNELSNLIGPFSTNGKTLISDLPTGDHAELFRKYWDEADQTYIRLSSNRPPLNLLDRINHLGGLKAQLVEDKPHKVIYNASGNNLVATVATKELITSHSTYWAAFSNPQEAHYIAAILNATCLNDYFSEVCKATDRGFMLMPVQNLPIPKFAKTNKNHANLAKQSEQAHAIVAQLVADSANGKKIARNQVMNHPKIKPILESIDQSVKAILPEYCS